MGEFRRRTCDGAIRSSNAVGVDAWLVFSCVLLHNFLLFPSSFQHPPLPLQHFHSPNRRCMARAGARLPGPGGRQCLLSVLAELRAVFCPLRYCGRLQHTHGPGVASGVAAGLVGGRADSVGRETGRERGWLPGRGLEPHYLSVVYSEEEVYLLCCLCFRLIYLYSLL